MYIYNNFKGVRITNDKSPFLSLSVHYLLREVHCYLCPCQRKKKLSSLIWCTVIYTKNFIYLFLAKSFTKITIYFC